MADRLTPEHAELLRSAVLGASFLRLTCSQPARRGEPGAPERVTVRPVLLKTGRCLQFASWDGVRETVVNCELDQARPVLDAHLAAPFRRYHVQSGEGDLHVTVSRGGKVLVSRGRASRAPADLRHDREKPRLLSPDSAPSRRLFQALGMADEGGDIRPSMQAKYRQVNEFLRIVADVVGTARREATRRDRETGGRLQVVDLGCGSSVLTFAVHAFLNHVLDCPADVMGVDRREDLVAKGNAMRSDLGWPGPVFRTAEIGTFTCNVRPHMVLSLHACDDATDQAIARAVGWGSSVILAAPCCQHEFHHELKADAFRTVLRQGILRERLGELLTDAFRAQILRVLGYRTSIVEFVAPEYTPKNLLIRAERGVRPGLPEPVQEYLALREFWHVVPSLETLLGDDFQRLLRPDGGDGRSVSRPAPTHCRRPGTPALRAPERQDV